MVKFIKKNNNKPLVIAEIGNNHEGKISVAKKLIDLAKKSGADAVKFQTFKTESFIHSSEKKRFNILKKFELSYREFKQLAIYSKKKKLKFISTPFDFESAKFLNSYVDYFKISSGDNNFYELIKQILKYKKPIIISLGFLNFKEIKNLEKFILKFNRNKNEIFFLHCISSYPTNLKDLNLNVIKKLKKELRVKIGFSDHSVGIEAPIIAAILGAEIIEKHFTISKKYSKFRDHQLSADYEDMKKIVNFVNKIDEILGSPKKNITFFEKKIYPIARRSIYFKKDLKKGDKVEKKDLIYLRPFKGNNPNDDVKIIGKKINKKAKAGKIVSEQYFDK